MKDQSVDDGVEVAVVTGRFRKVGDTELGDHTTVGRGVLGLLDGADGKVEADNVVSFFCERQCRDADATAGVENRAAEPPLTFQGGEFGLQFTDIPAGISGGVGRLSVVELIPVDGVHIKCWHGTEGNYVERWLPPP